MSLIDMFDECEKYVEPDKRLHVLEFYAEQFSRIPRAYQLMPASDVMTWVERTTTTHFKQEYFKKFEEVDYCG